MGQTMRPLIKNLRLISERQRSDLKVYVKDMVQVSTGTPRFDNRYRGFDYWSF